MRSKEVGRKKEKKSATGLGGKKLQTHFLIRVLGDAPSGLRVWEF